MGTKDDRVDAYIAKSADFAKPILTHLRDLVHATCPDVEETMKWSFPNFMYKGMLCSMASFKEHCSFGFWKSSLIVGEKGGKARPKGMGQLGKDHQALRPAVEEGPERLHQGGDEAQRDRRQVADPTKPKAPKRS